MQSATHARGEKRLINMQLKRRQMLRSKNASTRNDIRTLIQKQLARNEKSEYQTAVLCVVLRGASKCERQLLLLEKRVTNMLAKQITIRAHVPAASKLSSRRSRRPMK